MRAFACASLSLLFALFALVLLVDAGGCAGGAALETATEMPKAPRRPDGVVLDTPPALPAAADRATASGIVALR
ncbi:MAG: hypothetical protein QOI41_4109, partial [Myxococcales bacterium]|nr:hypothetical protein [Myxococcales bacterium]